MSQVLQAKTINSLSVSIFHWTKGVKTTFYATSSSMLDLDRQAWKSTTPLLFFCNENDFAKFRYLFNNCLAYWYLNLITTDK